MNKHRIEYVLLFKKPHYSFLSFIAISICILSIYTAFIAFATLDKEKDSPERVYIVREKKKLVLQLLEFERLHGRSINNEDAYEKMLSSLIDTLKNNQTNCLIKCYDRKGLKGSIEII